MKIIFIVLFIICGTSVYASDDLLDYGIPSSAVKRGPYAWLSPESDAYCYIVSQTNIIAKEFYVGSNKIEQILYKNGKLYGAHRKWHSNGRLSYEGFYTNNYPHGIFREWNTNGQLTAYYKMIKGTGTRRVYDNNGKLVQEAEYQKSHIINMEYYKSKYENNGQIITYIDGMPSGQAVYFNTNGVNSLCFNETVFVVGPQVHFNTTGSVVKVEWKLIGGAVSEQEYMQASATNTNLPPYFADHNRYYNIIDTNILNLIHYYNTLPPVKIPLEFDAAGNPVPR